MTTSLTPVSVIEFTTDENLRSDVAVRIHHVFAQRVYQLISRVLLVLVEVITRQQVHHQLTDDSQHGTAHGWRLQTNTLDISGL